MKLLYTGGARSGKSWRAQQVGERLGQSRLFIATAEALDEDMRARIDRHRQDRGEGWATVEEPRAPARVLREARDNYQVILLDCLTLWVSNLVCDEITDAAFHAALDGLEAAVRDCPSHLLLVSNEVGMGLVPGEAISRRYRDLLGRTNQRLAAACDALILLVAGQPLVIKGSEP